MLPKHDDACLFMYNDQHFVSNLVALVPQIHLDDEVKNGITRNASL